MFYYVFMGHSSLQIECCDSKSLKNKALCHKIKYYVTMLVFCD